MNAFYNSNGSVTVEVLTPDSPEHTEAIELFKQHNIPTGQVVNPYSREAMPRKRDVWDRTGCR
ncbi:MAG: hypothetical protein ACREAU_01670 [Nitrosopumilaceae archaeon]